MLAPSQSQDVLGANTKTNKVRANVTVPTENDEKMSGSYHMDD